MEYRVQYWMGFMTGWHARILEIKDQGYILRRPKNRQFLEKYNSLYFPLENNVVIDIASTKKSNTPKDDSEFEIRGREGVQYLRAESKEEKLEIISRLNERIKKGSFKKVFSKDYEEYRDEISKNSVGRSPFELIVVRFTYFQNLFLEMNQKLDHLNSIIHDPKYKSVCQDLFKIHFDINAIKEEMKKQFDDVIKSVFDYRDQIKLNKGEITLMEGSNPPPAQVDFNRISDVNLQKIEVTNPEENLAQTQPKLSQNISENLLIDEQSHTELSNQQSQNPNDSSLIESESEDEHPSYQVFSTNENDFFSNEYENLPDRSSLPKPIQTGSNMIKEFVKSLGAKKMSLPIYFNEPISMLEKQYERFLYSDLLEKAAAEDNKELQMIFIAGFLLGEIFLSVGRLLKPFNPILGETYEYFDNQKKIRFLAEQVSHNPPISAFICEGLNYAYFGDTRSTTSFKIWKGCLEVTFTNKTHVILRRTNDYYVFTRPSVLMKGLVKGNVHSDYVGEFCLQHTGNEKCKCVINFIEESKKSPLGAFEGKVYNEDGEIAYIIGGNCNKDFYYTKPDGQDKVVVIELDENEEYLKNSQEKYVLPKCAFALNIIDEELKKILPPTDSRLRPDLREYEEKDTEYAQKLKLLIEEKQRMRHAKFEEEKIKYKPEFFVNEFNSKSNDNVYLSNGKYWALRKAKKLNNVENKDIFKVEEPKEEPGSPSNKKENK